MFKNKHIVIAMLVAPVLAIMAWFAVDYFVAERPHAAQDGAAYVLVAKSNCRYESGRCDLENADFKLSVRPASETAESMLIEVSASHPLQSASVGLVDSGAQTAPVTMTAKTREALIWTGLIDLPGSKETALRIAVTAQGATWYAEVPTVFLRDTR